MKKGSRSARAVIGAGYGDEGKGVLTDWMASSGASVVVRTNGGAQAGHTVTDPEGRRHVFKHFASGAMAGVRTHLARRFVLHPMLFSAERDALSAMGAETAVTADPRAAVTVPWDVMLNQFIESRRGTARHGSCGIGFGEAVERGLRPEFALAFADLASGRDVRPLLRRIREEWVEPRLAALGGGDLTQDERALVMDDGILEAFAGDCAAFASAVEVAHDADIKDGAVFEGAQGLLLDQDYGAFPHVTRSNTGVVNMAEAAAEAGIGLIEAVYVTRAYVSRHGAGPMAHEGDRMDWLDCVDPTNRPNEWQGSLRLAPLDLDVLSSAVRHDASRAPADVEVSVSMAVTCLDQIEGKATVHRDGRPSRTGAEGVAAAVSEACGAPVAVTFSSPARCGAGAGLRRP